MTYEEKLAELNALLSAVDARIQQSYSSRAPRGRAWNSTRSSDNRRLHRQLEERRNKRGEAQIRPLKPIHGWRTGDIAKRGNVVGRISPRSSGSFEIRAPGGKPFSRPMRLFTPIHRSDGYDYAG